MITRKQIRSLFQHWVAKETLTSFKLAWPIAVSLLLQQFVYTVSLAFTAHTAENSAVALDAVGLASSTISVTARCTASGLCGALDTLASQAWGAQAFKRVGVYAQRAVLILTLVALLMYGLFFNMESILHLIHQPPCVIDYAVQYMMVFSSCLPAIFLIAILQRYLQIQKVIYPIIIAGLVGNAVNALAHYLFLRVAMWCVRGAAAAVAITWYAFAITIVAIIYLRKLHVKSWGGWSRDSLNGWGQFMRFGLPGFVMLFAEWGSFELGIFLTGIVDPTQQTLYVLVTSWISALFMVPVSIAIATSIRIGNNLGAGEPKNAKRAFFIGACLTFVWIVFVTIINLSLKAYIPRLFTSDERIIALSSTVMIIATVLCIVDHSQVLLSGVVRGLGKQALGAVGNIIAFWGVGIPIGIGLLFGANLGAFGFLSGFSIAAFIQLLALGVVAFTSNWWKQSEKARARAGVKSLQSTAQVLERTDSESNDFKDAEDELPLHPLGKDYDHVTPSSKTSPCNGHANKITSSEMQEGKNEIASDEDYVSDFGSVANPKEDLDESCSQNDLLNDDVKVDFDSEPLLHPNNHHSDMSQAANENQNSLQDTPTITKKTVFLRVVTVLIFVVFFLTSVVFSQLYVYRGGVCVERNVTSNLTETAFNNSEPLIF